MYLTLDKKGTLYEQIARAIKMEILEGRVLAGSKLPSTRTLATALGVARKSVLQAYDLLCAEELAIARAGSGTRVAKVNPAARPPVRTRVAPASRYATRVRLLPPITLAGAHVSGRPRYNLVYGEPLIDSALFHSWRRKLAAAALRAGPTYPAAGGYMPLRRAIADYLARRRGVLCNASDILIVAGTQQALTVVERVLLDPGDRVIVEDPHYQLAVHSLLAHGARVKSARTDEEGLVVSELPQRPTRLVFVTPSHQFPSGVVMTLNRRLELLKWAARTGSWIFEDDYDTEFHAGNRPLPALRSLDLADRVLYVGSFSKTLFPSLRLGYIVCPAALRDALYKAKLLDDLGSPSVEQAALATFIQSRQYEKHLRKSVKELINRRRTVVEALQRLTSRHVEIGPHHAGMHLVIWFRHMRFDRLGAFIDRAKSLGLGLHPIHPYYRAPPPRPGLLIGYAGLSVGQLKTAVELFARCLDGEVPANSGTQI
ncbi:MAG TPA: PLP-dependent aminotransferase family protein [Steroidobacteraceae bacterium]|jgi:GntR family transcriptional regulator/MocR family aminotransferase|nr:PLP-dependent aminotransferase family protein [Steroidobacteraceae bacterium]